MPPISSAPAMLQYRLPEQPMTDEDVQTLKRLALKYSPQTLMSTLRLMPESSSRNSTSIPSSGWSTTLGYPVSEDSRSRKKPSSIVSDRDSRIEPSSAPIQDQTTPAHDRGYSSTAVSPQRTRPPSEDSRGTDSPRPPVTEKIYYCPFCNVYGISVHFKRKFDCKRHIFNFHCSDSIWVCPHPECLVVFDFRDAYVQHVKTEHLHTTPMPDKARVELCHQLVFACGFPTCKEKLFEAKGAEDAVVEAKKFCDHVAKHFEEERVAVSVSDWEYSVQMQNLLRQEALKGAWKDYLGKEHRAKLRWHPRSSCEFKKILECRAMMDAMTPIHFAHFLGSPSLESPDRLPPYLPPMLARPVRDASTEPEAAPTGSTSLHPPGQGTSQTTHSQDTLSVPISPTGLYGTEPWVPSVQHPHDGSPPTLLSSTHTDAGFWYSTNSESPTHTREIESWNPSPAPLPPSQAFAHHPSSQYTLQDFAIDAPAVQSGPVQLAAQMDTASLAARQPRQRLIQYTPRSNRDSVADIQMNENPVDPTTYPPTQPASLLTHSGNAAQHPGMMTMGF